MPNIFSDFLRGLAQSSQTFPQTMQTRLSLQQQQKERERQEAQQRLRNLMLGASKGAIPSLDDQQAINQQFGAPPQGTPWEQIYGKPTPPPQIIDGYEITQERDPEGNLVTRPVPGLVEEEPLFQPWKFNADMTRGIRVNNKTGAIQTKEFKWDTPPDPEKLAKELKAKNDLVQLHRKSLTKQMPTQVLKDLAYDAKSMNITFDEYEWADINDSFAQRALDVEAIMPATLKTKTWVMGTVATLAQEALNIMQGSAEVRKGLGRFTGSKYLLEDFITGGQTVPEDIAVLISKLAQMKEVFARNQTGAQINPDESADFYNIVGRLNISEEGLAVRIPELINLANIMITEAYDQALTFKGEPQETLSLYRDRYPLHKVPDYITQAERAQFKALSQKARQAGGQLENDEAEEYNALVERFKAAGEL